MSAFRKYVPISPMSFKTLSYLSGRNPLHNVTNWPNDLETIQSSFTLDNLQLHEACVDGMEKENDGVPGSCGMTLTRKQKAQAFKIERGILPVSVSDDTNSDGKQTKVDLRKTSWMNGFMMYSRLNRRRFIEANPGVLTSNISKMMGQAWRNMSDMEQIPYKEKAKQFSREMQRDQENYDLDVFGSDEEPHYTLGEPITEESLDSLLTVKQEQEFLF
ncbi:transcription factor Sox-17-alpha-like [Gigantopelta aegis]|uniref:transcription factor Sox-17-alpha-like n=1 Tax=Gigantopelta aegis TaxID=1735272 RepID=UPI001B88DDC7|nr:transcription factor Sox-17-alpha-like [Gigantopelta aegis]